MNDYNDSNQNVKQTNDMANLGFHRPRLCDDPYYAKGSDFPLPDENTSKGIEGGPQSLVAQSETQKDAGLNASEGVNRASTWGAEGKTFPVAPNSKASLDERPTFAGSKDSTVSVNLVSGQINSAEPRLIPVPENKNDGKMRPLLKFKKAKGDARENRI